MSPVSLALLHEGAALVAGEEHGEPFGDAGADQGAGGGAATIVEEAGRHAGRLTGRAPRARPCLAASARPVATCAAIAGWLVPVAWTRPAAHRRAVSGPCRPPARGCEPVRLEFPILSGESAPPVWRQPNVDHVGSWRATAAGRTVAACVQRALLDSHPVSAKRPEDGG